MILYKRITHYPMTRRAFWQGLGLAVLGLRGLTGLGWSALPRLTMPSTMGLPWLIDEGTYFEAVYRAWDTPVYLDRKAPERMIVTVLPPPEHGSESER